MYVPLYVYNHLNEILRVSDRIRRLEKESHAGFPVHFLPQANRVLGFAAITVPAPVSIQTSATALTIVQMEATKRIAVSN